MTDTTAVPEAGIVLSARGALTIDLVEDTDRELDRRRVRIHIGDTTIFVERRFVPVLINSLRAAIGLE